jgi:hydroxypyruvate isomerase
MWTVVYIAPSKAMAERVRQALEQEGLLVNMRTLESGEDGRGSVEILVPEGEAEEAHEVLANHLGRLR